MFRQLLATAAVSVCCLGNPSAMAQPTTCWISDTTPRAGERVAPQTCDISYRKNANGHSVIDLVSISDGYRVSIVLWKDSNNNPTYAELFFEQHGRSVWQYRIDEEGDVNLYHPGTGYEIWFRTPSVSYQTTVA